MPLSHSNMKVTKKIQTNAIHQSNPSKNPITNGLSTATFLSQVKVKPLIYQTMISSRNYIKLGI